MNISGREWGKKSKTDGFRTKNIKSDINWAVLPVVNAIRDKHLCAFQHFPSYSSKTNCNQTHEGFFIETQNINIHPSND